MNAELIEKCDLLVKNYELIRESIKWESNLMILAASSYYVGLGLEADSEKLKECNEILKNKAGVFSNYRGNVKVPLLCRMAIAENPEEYFEEINAIVDLMQDLKWINKEYKVIAAITINEHTEKDHYQNAIEKMEDLYKGMKENHPWLTSGEDIPFAAMLSVSDLDTNVLLRETENCYQILKDYFFDKNAVQSLSHVLAVNEENAAAKCDKVKRIWDLLKEKNNKYGTGYELAVLGTLCLLDIPVNTMVEEIIEANEYLKQQKGFGNFSLGKKTRLMYAALMVTDAHISSTSINHESIIASTHAIVITMQICMLLIVTSTTVMSSSN